MQKEKSRIFVEIIFIFLPFLFAVSCIRDFFFPPHCAHAQELSSSPNAVLEQSDEKKEETIGKYHETAESLYRKGRYVEAIEVWNKVIAIDAEDVRAKEGIKMAERKIAKIRDFFGDDAFGDFEFGNKFSLKDCIQVAEENHIPLQVAREQIELSKIRVWEARRDFLPALTLSRTESKAIRTEGKVESIEYGIEGKQPAFYSGELIFKLAQSKVNLSLTESNYANVKSELYLEVAKAYFAFVKARKILEYTKGLYESFKPLYAMARDKYEKALVSDIEHLNAESKFNQLYYKSISVESDFELARLTLSQRLNMEDQEDLDVDVDTMLRRMDKDLGTCYSLALANRPDLKVKELTVKSADYGKKITEAKERPQVDFTGHYKRASEVYRQDYSAPREEAGLDPKKKWYAGLEVNWPLMGSTGSYSVYKRKNPRTLSAYDVGSETTGATLKLGIFDNMKQFSTAEEAEIAFLQAQKELDETRKKVIKEVKEAFCEYEKARVQTEAAKAQKVFREKEIKILETKHNLGEIELSELFDSMIRLMEANEAYFEAEEKLNISIAALHRAVGHDEYF